MTDKIMALADAYAAAKYSYGHVPSKVDVPRVALLASVEELKAEDAELKAELNKAQDELNCAEESCEAFACEFAEDGYNQGFECIGEFVLALHKSANAERDALKAENAKLRELLKPFARAYLNYTIENIDAARAALENKHD